MKKSSEGFSNKAILSKSFRTMIEIARALSSLCEQLPYSQISVEMIARQAKISRSGFYNYFEDKNSIIQWLSLLHYSNGIDNIGRTMTWFEGYLATTKGLVQFLPLLRSEADNVGYSAGGPTFVRHRQQNLRETLTEYQHLELSANLAFQIEALSYCEEAMAMNYYRGHYDYSVREFCDMLVKAVPQELYQALADPTERKVTKGDFWLTSNWQ
ncbi:MAG: TetR/AcrR family transcriptional regulator [Coriobacteriales bacterium]|nr:TetR/AcrR family transcriptional regulator [Coriobacteriales bacterium]